MSIRLKVVIDTNVLISSLWGGNPKQVIDLWKKGRIILVLSNEIVREYLDVLKRFSFPKEIYVEFMDLMLNGELVREVKATKKLEVIKDDPEDNKFLECALGGNADFHEK